MISAARVELQKMDFEIYNEDRKPVSQELVNILARRKT